MFDLFGIDQRGWETDGLSMMITNSSDQTIELRFANRNENDQWNEAMLHLREDIVKDL